MTLTLLVSALFLCAVNVGGSKEIKAKCGEDVTLQCEAPTDSDEVVKLLRWSNPDLKSQGYVFFLRDNRSYEKYQLLSFHDRVELRDPQMKDGDISVTLKNVTINDTGTYECYVGNGSWPQLITTINLTVADTAGHSEDGGNKDEGDKDGHVGLVVGLLVAVLLVIAVLLGVCCCRRRRPDQNSYKLPAEHSDQEEV